MRSRTATASSASSDAAAWPPSISPRDLKHERSVALKVLRPEVAATLGPSGSIARSAWLHGSSTPTSFRYTIPAPPPASCGTRCRSSTARLRDRLRRERQLPLEEALLVTREVADALGDAHSQGIVHRDIKPENILLSHRDALVADFGIARALQRPQDSSTRISWPLHDSGEAARILWYTMPYVEGESLRDRLARQAQSRSRTPSESCARSRTRSRTPTRTASCIAT